VTDLARARRVRRLPVASVGGAPAQGRELRRQGRETLRRLCDGAITVFAERGYNGARVDDIVKRARTSHGTFYLYFSNKEDLFQALVVGVTDEMRELADDLPPISPDQSGLDQLREWIGRFYDLYEHYFPVIRAWTELNASNPEMARNGARVLRRFIDQLVRRVGEIHPAPVAHPETAALAMASMLERATFYAVVGMVKVSRDELVDNLATILHGGLFGGARRG
jgi:AcrR family transcriptional regulator